MSKNIIGKFQGREVYKVTLSEYINNRYYKDKYYIFLIDGELIYNNVAFASYDGNYVTNYDYNKKHTFYEVPVFTASGGIGNKPLNEEGHNTANGNFESKISSISGNETKIPPKSVEETLAGVFNSSVIEGVYETDYFSGMTDVDAFLKANLEF